MNAVHHAGGPSPDTAFATLPNDCLHGDRQWIGLDCVPLVSSHIPCSTVRWSGRCCGGRGDGRVAFEQLAEWLKWHTSSQWLNGSLQVSSTSKIGAPHSPTSCEAPGIGWRPANPLRQRPSARRLRSCARPSHWVSFANPTRFLRFLVLDHTCSPHVYRCPRRYWLADLVGERASASARPVVALQIARINLPDGWVSAFYRRLTSPLSYPTCKSK